MEAYASVDNQVRRKMDEMLKTWKEPVPGSLENRPVFPLDVVRPIENALIKARTSALQAQQERMARGRPGQPYRETPTPPGMRPGPGPPPGTHVQHFQPMNGSRQGEMSSQTNPPHQPYHHDQVRRKVVLPSNRTYLTSIQPQQLMPGQPVPQAATPLSYAPPTTLPIGFPAPGLPAPGISVETLNNDISSLIAATKAEFALNPYEPSIQTRLRALLDLQSILQRQNLPQEQLMLVKNQVDDLAVKIRPRSVQPTLTSIPVHQLPPPPAVQVASSPTPGRQPQAPISIDSLLGQGALAALLAKQPATPTPQAQVPTPTPPVPFSHVALRSPPQQQVTPQQPVAAPAPPSSAAPSDPMALLSRLRQAGLLSGALPAQLPTPALGPSFPRFPIPPPASIPPNIADILAKARASGPRRPLDEMNDISLNASSLKQP
jgi:pre-mRNA cleavage complex 2 protein Pcf11